MEPIQVVLASLEPGVVGEQQGFQLAVQLNQDLKWAASTASPSAALIAGWVSYHDSCNWAKRAFTLVTHALRQHPDARDRRDTQGGSHNPVDMRGCP